LQHKVDPSVNNCLAHSIRLVSDDGVNILRRHDIARGSDYMCQQRLSSDLVQNLGMFRFQARPFARRHNRDGDARNGMRIAPGFRH
jgi:hypothetical protein